MGDYVFVGTGVVNLSDIRPTRWYTVVGSWPVPTVHYGTTSFGRSELLTPQIPFESSSLWSPSSLNILCQGPYDSGQYYSGYWTPTTWYYFDDIWMGNYSGVVRQSAVLFSNVAVGNGSILTSVSLNIKAYANDSGNSCKIKVYANNVDSAALLYPPNFTPAGANALALTTAYTKIDLMPPWTSGTWYSIDVTTAVQEVVNRQGWVSGNNILLVIRDNTSSLAAHRVFYGGTWNDSSWNPKGGPILSLTAGESGFRTYGDAIFGDQNAPMIYAADFPDISSGDFTIESRFRIETLFKGEVGDPETRYVLIGQYESTYYNGNGTEGDYWELSLVTDFGGTAYFEFRVWQAGVFVTDITAPVTIDWEAEWSDNHKQNESLTYDHVVVVRSGASVFLYVRGLLVSSGDIYDWEPMTNSIQVNGQTGRMLEEVPYSVTAVDELRVLDYALYLSEFPVPDVFTQPPGMCMFPRMYPVLRVGEDGDIRGSFFFAPRASSYIRVGEDGDIRINSRFLPKLEMDGYLIPEIEGSLGFSFGFVSSLALLGELNLGLYAPSRPMVQIKMSGWDETLGVLNVNLWQKISDMEGEVSCLGSLNISLPLKMSSLLAYDEVMGTLSVSLKKAFYGSGLFSETGVLGITLPRQGSSIFGDNGIGGTLSVTIPIDRISITGLRSVEGVLSLSVPLLTVAFAMLSSTSPTMVMNLRNKALTIYENYDFNSLCRFNDRHFGATSTGIYDLDLGDTDNGTLIEWNFKTGYLDLEQKFKKKLRQAWFSYKSNGDLIVTVVLPVGTEYEYPLDGIYQTETGLRVKFGKGIRTKYFALDVKNVDGSTIDLDELKIHFEKIEKVR